MMMMMMAIGGGGNKKTKVNTNILLVEQSLSTLIKKIHSITGIPFTFLFCIPTPLHIQMGIHVVFVMAFHI